MLEVWLENDVSAGWEKLRNVLEENEQLMLVEKIKTMNKINVFKVITLFCT